MPRLFCIVLMVSALSLASQSSAQVFKALYSFADSSAIQRINLVLSNDTLFGTVDGDGATNEGSVFMLETDGTGFTNLHSFIGSDGAYPSGRMVYRAPLFTAPPAVVARRAMAPSSRSTRMGAASQTFIPSVL